VGGFHCVELTFIADIARVQSTRLLDFMVKLLSFLIHASCGFEAELMTILITIIITIILSPSLCYLTDGEREILKWNVS